MRRLFLAVLCIICAVSFSGSAFARGKKKILRGGLGFVLSDHNDFIENPGQMARSRGGAFEGKFQSQEVGSSKVKALDGSFSYSNGNIGIGLFGQRSGTKLDTTATDTAGGALGFAVAKQKFTFGAGFQKVISGGAPNDGVVSGGLNFNATSKGNAGPVIGAGATRTLGTGTNVTSAFASFGYSFKAHNNHFEFAVSLPDIDNTNNYTGHFYINVGARVLYLAAGYNYIKTGSTTDHKALGRLGFVLGQVFDFSVFGSKIFKGGNKPVLGGSLRLAF